MKNTFHTLTDALFSEHKKIIKSGYSGGDFLLTEEEKWRKAIIEDFKRIRYELDIIHGAMLFISVVIVMVLIVVAFK